MNNNIGDVVFISISEEIWNKPFVCKTHHNYKYRSVILRCRIVENKDNEFKAQLTDNNDFEKDGQIFVFNKLQLLVYQNFTNFKSLGVWKNY